MKGKFIGLLLLVISSCSSSYDLTQQREKLIENFYEEESNFEDLISYFREVSSIKDDFIVTFGLKGDSVFLKILNTKKSIISGNNPMSLSQKKLDDNHWNDILSTIGWDKKILKDLKNKIHKVDCNFIRSTEFLGNPIEVYKAPEGIGNYSYYFFETMSDSLRENYGKPLGNSGFARQVCLVYTSAL